jgi:uncharacterized protein (TIGR02145 family)
MKNTRNVLIIFLLICLSVLKAQVGIGTTTPHSSAALDVESTMKGVLLSRMTRTQRNAITNPAHGLTIFNTENNCLEFWNGKFWVSTCDGAADVPVVFVNGREWMDRNLGATQSATSSTDASAYGDLYQWGRAADGHEKRTSSTTTTLSSGDQPGNNQFIIHSFDWRSTANNNLWQNVNSINNPCPSGFSVPTIAEWSAASGASDSWTISWANASAAFNSPLRLPLAGLRDRTNGNLTNVGATGYYWTRTLASSTDPFNPRPPDTMSLMLIINSSPTRTASNRSSGASVRCIKGS